MVLLSLAVGSALSASVGLSGTARQADAAVSEKIVFSSNRTTGTGVNNPTGDGEIFKMNPDGTGLRQLTFNKVDDADPTLSPDGKKVAYTSYGIQTSNPEGDDEVYVMNILDGSSKKNLSNTGSGVTDNLPVFSPGGARIAYESKGKQTSNPEGDHEVYRVNVLDGKGKKNLTNNGSGVGDYTPAFSPDGTKIAYESYGVQRSNPEGDSEVYRMKASDGSGKKNLTNTDGGVGDYSPVYSPDGQKISYTSQGKQTSNSEGEQEIYAMNASDGSGQTNLTNTELGISDYNPVYSPDGQKIAYSSSGIQTSNPEGEQEIYAMNASDGSGQTNLTNNDSGVVDTDFDFSPDGKKVAYISFGIQTSNPEGDSEVYRMDASDGFGKKNLSNNGSGVGDAVPDWGRQAT